MSRFTPARRTAIAVWTGASVLWATTLTALTMEPAADSSPEDDQRSAEMAATSSAAMPNLPGSGLVVVRGPAPASDEGTTTKAVQVGQTAPATAPSPTPAPAPAPAPDPPQPVSSGS